MAKIRDRQCDLPGGSRISLTLNADYKRARGTTADKPALILSSILVRDLTSRRD